MLLPLIVLNLETVTPSVSTDDWVAQGSADGTWIEPSAAPST